MRLWEWARHACRRLCVEIAGQALLAVRSLKSYWWMYLPLTFAAASWIGWQNERAEKIGQLETIQQELRDYRDQSTLLKERILGEVRSTRRAMQILSTSQQQGPYLTARETKQILADIRESGLHLPHYPVEDRSQ